MSRKFIGDCGVRAEEGEAYSRTSPSRVKYRA